MRLTLLTATFTILFAHTMAVAAPKPALLTPTAPWNVDFADKMCLLIRPYGKDQLTHLMFKPAMLGDSLEIIVTRAKTPITGSEDGKAVLSIGGIPSQAESYFKAYSTVKMRLLRIWIKEGAITLAAVRGSLQIDAKPEGRFAFAIPGIDQALPVLAKCVEQLRAAYKVSDVDLAAIATKPDASPASIFSTDDYPREALQNGEVGTVGALFWIEADGRVSSCEVIESSASPILEKTTCNILTKRARFTPAKDAAGRALRAPSFSRIRWELPS